MTAPRSSIWPEGYGMGPSPGRQLQTLFCQRCGAVVMSSPLHTRWHQELDYREATKDVKVSKKADPQSLWADREPLGRITRAQQSIADTENDLALAVADARTIGHSWAAIAKALGVTRQSAQKRWARKLSEMSS